MNVSLTDKLAGFVDQLVEQGSYCSASEVVREGLHLLEIRAAQLQPKLQKDKGFGKSEKNKLNNERS